MNENKFYLVSWNRFFYSYLNEKLDTNVFKNVHQDGLIKTVY